MEHPTIDQQLEAEAILKTERLQELIREAVSDALQNMLHNPYDFPVTHTSFAYALLQQFLASSDFEAAVKRVMVQKMQSITTNTSYW